MAEEEWKVVSRHNRDAISISRHVNQQEQEQMPECRYFAMGMCRFGSNCRFRHTVEEPRHVPEKVKPKEAELKRPPMASVPVSEIAQSDKRSWAQAAATFGTNEPSAPLEVQPLVIEEGEKEPPQEEVDDTIAPELCQWHTVGQCLAGGACAFVHGSVCPFCDRAVLLPEGGPFAEKHMKKCEDIMLRGGESFASLNVECGICYEKPALKDRKFGLLVNCSCAFCLECLRTWRQQASGPGSGAPRRRPFGGLDLETVRSCPLCRVPSEYIIPSTNYVSNPQRKLELIQQYRERISRVECRYFAKGEGECPFGTSCFYAHVLPDGTLADESRTVATGENQVRVVRDVKLSDFLFPQKEKALLIVQPKEEEEEEDDVLVKKKGV